MIECFPCEMLASRTRARELSAFSRCRPPEGRGRLSWKRGLPRGRGGSQATVSSDGDPRSRCGLRSAQTLSDQAANERRSVSEVASFSRRKSRSPLLTVRGLSRHLITQPIPIIDVALSAQTRHESDRKADTTLLRELSSVEQTTAQGLTRLTTRSKHSHLHL